MRWILLFVLAAVAVLADHGADGQTAGARLFVDCSQKVEGSGSLAHPWNSLQAAEAHPFAAGDRIALARGTVCNGSFSPQGSGTQKRLIRLTAYGQGPRPRIIASASDRQILLLFNQEYWQIDSLDLSGGNTYGVFVSGDKGTLHHIYLRNLYVHDVMGGAMKNKDNGLVVVGPSSPSVFFADILLDGVVVAHTNQWAGILIGGGPFPYPPDAPLNKQVTVRNSSVQDVYGDGIVLFRDSDSVVETSTAWQTGMQPTETIGTPNAIWTWTCTDCIVRDNEAFLTDSPGVDGGAYDIDWDNTRNTVERNYAHDTQGYCFAVFAAGYVTSESVVRDNLCIDNGESPRLAALQGAVYLHTWDNGVIRNLRMEGNTIVWNPPVSAAAAIVDDAGMGDAPASFTGNRIESAASLFYRTNAQLAPSTNTYRYDGAGDALFTLGDRHNVTLAALQEAGLEKGTTLGKGPAPTIRATSLRLDATVDFALDADGLLASGPRAQLMVLRSLAAQYGPAALAVTVHFRVASGSSVDKVARVNALLDLGAGPIHFDDIGNSTGNIRLLASDGRLLEEWHGFQNAATLGGTVRKRLGAPRFAQMPQTTRSENRQ
ncbi:MAG: right-handed parallel beta-helix repeat-containing protein [Terracidiphilus sp.]